MRIRLLVALVSCLTLSVLAAPAAHASCAGFQGTLKKRLAGHDTVFVGTVQRADSSGRLATVKVESVWRGEVTPTAIVAGGAVDGGAITSVDRTYEVGTRYLFTPHAFADGRYADNSCTDTQEWTRKLERLRPRGATPVSNDAAHDDAASPAAVAAPSNTPGGPASGLGTAIIIAVAVVLLGGAAAVIARRRPISVSVTGSGRPSHEPK